MKVSKVYLIVCWALACLSSILYLLLFNFGPVMSTKFFQMIFFTTWLSVFVLMIMLLLVNFNIWKNNWSFVVLSLTGISNVELNWFVGKTDFNLYSIFIVPSHFSYRFMSKELNIAISFPIGALLLLLIMYFRQKNGQED